MPTIFGPAAMGWQCLIRETRVKTRCEQLQDECRGLEVLQLRKHQRFECSVYKCSEIRRSTFDKFLDDSVHVTDFRKSYELPVMMNDHCPPYPTLHWERP